MSISRVIAFIATMALTFATVPALAEDDPAHPAYHFEPTIIVKADISASASSTPAVSAPAAAVEKASAPLDSQYPAANFTPILLYPESLAR